MSLIVSGLSTATLILDIALISVLALFAAKKAGYTFDRVERLEGLVAENTTEIVFVISAVATLGSLYFSNILGYEPCRLCWFQRIFLYPVAFLSGTSLFLDRTDMKDYVMSLVLVGTPIALYHSLIQRIEQFHSAGCSVTAVSCSTEYTFHYGYITIPVMALTAFLVIIFVLWRFED